MAETTRYFCLPMMPAAPPVTRPAPADLTVTRAADFLSAAVSWSAVSAAKEYKLYRADSFRADAAFSLVATITAPTVSYSDTGLTASKNYAYKVSAVVTAWETEGAKSAPVYTQGQNQQL